MRKDKARDIARGVLPSTARKSARENKRNYHAKHRGQQRRTNDAIVRSMNVVDDDGRIYTDPDLFDDFEEPTVYDGYHAATKDPSLGWDDDMGGIVQDRRNSDKLGPLIRWARATHDRVMSGPEWTVGDKVAYFRAILPDTLQGRHALGHVTQALDLHEDEFLYGRYRRYEPASRDEFRARLDKILSTSKGRMAFHDFRLATVPVAAHTEDGNNMIETMVHAHNENGEPLFYDINAEMPRIRPERHFPLSTRHRLRPYRKLALIPQPLAVTCDDCAFLRDDPLFDAEAVNRFVDIVWGGIRHARYRYQSHIAKRSEHAYLPALQAHVLGESV